LTTAVTLFPRTAVASRLTDRTDHARTAYAHRLHDADLSDPGLYDLIVATDKLGIEDVADDLVLLHRNGAIELRIWESPVPLCPVLSARERAARSEYTSPQHLRIMSGNDG